MITSSDVRKINKNKIRNIMLDGRSYTKRTLSQKTGLSIATCNTLLNAMESSKEVIGSKEKISAVGRNTVLYRLNESYESYLCLYYKYEQKIKSLHTFVLSPTKQILSEDTFTYDVLNADRITEIIAMCLYRFSNISHIIIGTPGVVRNGWIHHCDIPELVNIPLQHILANKFHIPVSMENDMHLMAYGYYKKEQQDSEVITLLNFPAHILPGTATICRNKIIRGTNGFAGMVGFLPYSMSTTEQLNALVPGKCADLILQATISIIAVLNPGKLVFTGDLITFELFEWLQSQCKNFYSDEHIPVFFLNTSLDNYYLEGMYHRILDSLEEPFLINRSVL